MPATQSHFFAATTTSSRVDVAAGTMRGVVLMESDREASGHGIWIDAKTLDTAIAGAPASRRVLAYVHHPDWNETDDRFDEAPGYFENIRVEGGKLLADFVAYQTFRDAEPELFAKLFEMATVTPELVNISIEAYGYGKGYGYVFDTFLPLLADLDRHSRAGRNVCLIAHDCTSTVPNPAGEDWLRYEPRLQSPASGKASIRLRVREWADHVLFVGYDVAVDKDGKGRGAGTRTLYTSELPHCMAKSRSTQEVIPVDRDGAAVWNKIIVG